MKNIHILPTDKPTWLHKSLVSDQLRKSSSCIDDMKQAQGINIYITNSEEIKEGDWWINLDNNKINSNALYNLANKAPSCKKIILTTDQDLIKDGVQKIDDEFLEWFVKNPSCEEVEVEKDKIFTNYNNPLDLLGRVYIIYKIIIPKEETKQQISYSEVFDWLSKKDYLSDKREVIEKEYKEYLNNG